MSVRFGDFELDRERRQLLRSGEPVPLEPKAYELLSLLAERRPRALSKAQIRDVVWAGVAVTDSALGVEVNAIREALGDDARQPRFIRTVHGFGYAFCGEAREDAPPDNHVVGPPRAGPTKARRVALLSAALGVLAVAVALGGWPWWTRAPITPAGPIRVAPLTADGGSKMSPQLSPDGERVAYAWARPPENNWDIYVKAVGTKPLRLTEDPRIDVGPVWSPDGRQIAFWRFTEQGHTIFTVPSLGGTERKLIDVVWPPPFVFSALSWSPDGRWLGFAESASQGGPTHIVRLSLETLEKEALTSPPKGTGGDVYPAFSPDGRRIAFVRSGSGWNTVGDLDLWVQSVGAGDARRLTFGEYDECSGLAWTARGTEILFSAGPWTEFARIHRVPLAGGEPQPVAALGQWAWDPSIRGSRLVHVQDDGAERNRIFRVPGPRASRRGSAPEVLIESNGSDLDPAWSPDGRRIAFESTRSGQTNIWVCDRDGSHPMQLTDFQKQTGTPRWSHDGQRIVFDSLEAGDWNIYVVDAAGGVARRLTSETSSDNRGVFSRDGRWIYFASDRGGNRQIWRMPSAGGPAVQVTRGGAVSAEVSADDRSLYYAKSEYDTAIWRVPVGGGEETEVVPGANRHAYELAVSVRSLVYATHEKGQGGVDEYIIRFRDLETGRVTELFRKAGAGQWALAVSPDEAWVLFGQASVGQSELILVENFR